MTWLRSERVMLARPTNDTVCTLYGLMAEVQVCLSPGESNTRKGPNEMEEESVMAVHGAPLLVWL